MPRVSCARLTLAVAIVFAFLLASARPAQAAEIRCGDTITSSVTITVNRICSGTGLFVYGNNITVDFAGHSLTGKLGAVTGISIGGDNVTIKNSTIKGFGVGIDGLGAAGGRYDQTISNVTLTGNGTGYNAIETAAVFRNVWVVANRGVGIYTAFAGPSIYSSHITRNGGDGIQVQGGNGVAVLDSFVSENGGYGLFTHVCTDAALFRNTFNNNDVHVGNDPCGAPSVVGGNIFRNSELSFGQPPEGWSPDLGGNRGNKCGLSSYIVCGPLP